MSNPTDQDVAALVARLTERVAKRLSDFERQVAKGWHNSMDEAKLFATMTLDYNDVVALLASEARATALEAERDAANARAEGQWAGWIKSDCARRASEAQLARAREDVMVDVIEETRRLKPHYQSATATDAGRCQMLDHFEKFALRSIPAPAASEVHLRKGWLKRDTERAAVRVAEWDGTKPAPSIHDYVSEYEFRGDADYTPNDHERALIEDALAGYVALLPAPADGRGEVKLREGWLKRDADKAAQRVKEWDATSKDLPSEARADRVKVKALNWSEPHPSVTFPSWHAGNPKLRLGYSIKSGEMLARGEFALFVSVGPSNNWVSGHKTLDAARAAAQADYEARHPQRPHRPGSCRCRLAGWRAVLSRRIPRSESRLIKRALVDAIGWQESLSEAYDHMPDDPARRDALELAKRYRALLESRYGSGRTPLEQATDGAPSVSILEIGWGVEPPAAQRASKEGRPALTGESDG